MISLAICPYDGLFEWLKWILFIYLMVLVFILIQQGNISIHSIATLFTFAGLVYSLIGIKQYVSLAYSMDVTHMAIYKVTVLSAHKNLYAEVLLLLFPFAFYSSVISKGFIRFIGIITSLAILFLITILMSRSVWIAFFISMALSLILYLIKTKPAIKKILIYGASFFVGISLLVGIFVWLFSYSGNNEAFYQQFLDIVHPHVYANSDRLGIWQRTFQIIKENPWFGSGMGAWKIEILKFGNVGLKTSDNLTFFQRPHNDFLWIISEQGFLAFIFYLAACGYLIGYTVKSFFQSIKREYSLMALVAFFAFVAYLTFSQFSFPKERIEHTIILAFYIVAVFLFDEHVSKKTKPKKYFSVQWLLLSGILLSSLALYVGIIRFKSEHYVRKAYDSWYLQSWPKVVENVDKAENPLFKIDPVSTPVEWYKGVAFYNMGNFSQAYQSFLMARAANPYHMHVLNNLATCYEKMNQHDSAIRLYKTALNLSPGFTEARYNLSSVYNELHDYKNAYKTFHSISDSIDMKKYNRFTVLIVGNYLRNKIDTCNSKEKEKIIRLINDTDLLVKINLESVKNNITIEEQLVKQMP